MNTQKILLALRLHGLRSTASKHDQGKQTNQETAHGHYLSGSGSARTCGVGRTRTEASMGYIIPRHGQHGEP